MYMCTMYVLWSEDNFVGLVLSFYFYVGHQDQNQLVRLWGECVYSLSHLASPLLIFFTMEKLKVS